MKNQNLYSEYKSGRILYLYTKLINGESINKTQEAEYFGVHQRSIQRDIDDLRAFFENQIAEGLGSKQLVYDKTMNCYCLRSKDQAALSNSEILAVCKILLESRSMCKSEMEPIISKLVDACIPKKNRAVVRALVSNEMFHYIEPQHHKPFVQSIWDIGNAIQQQKMMRIIYTKQDNTMVERIVKPVGIMFSEYYFYLTAFIDGIDRMTEYHNPDDVFPTIYRIDRIQEFEILDKKFDIPYKDRFEEGEFRKRVQFMYGGRLRNIKFRYTGKNVEAVLDRLPTAKILEKDDSGYVITAEVFGDGIDMWIRSQGNMVKIIKE